LILRSRLREVGNSQGDGGRDDRPARGGRLRAGGQLEVGDRSLPQAELATLVKEAHDRIRPYSHATRNNVDVQLTVIGR
jgi:osmotically inducible protein OsmC